MIFSTSSSVSRSPPNPYTGFTVTRLENSGSLISPEWVSWKTNLGARIDLLDAFDKFGQSLDITRHDLELGFPGPAFIGDGDRFQIDKRKMALEQIFIAFVSQIGRITLFIRVDTLHRLGKKSVVADPDFRF